MTINVSGHQIQFDHPEFLQWWWLVGAMLFATVIGALGQLAARALRNRYMHPEELMRTTRPLGVAGPVMVLAVWAAIGILFVAAAAEPYHSNQPIEVKADTAHTVLVYDGSQSMDQEAYRTVLPPPSHKDGTSHIPTGPWGSNFHMALWLSSEKIMKGMPGNPFALACSTADGRLVSTLRYDRQTLRYMMTETDWINAPGGGSDPAEGLRVAVQLLRKKYDPRKRNIIFLFSDGGISDLEGKNAEAKTIWERDFARLGNEMAAFKSLDGKGLEVIIVGLGSNVKTKVPVYYDDGTRIKTASGELDWFPHGDPIKQETALNEASLSMLQARIGNVAECRYIRVPQDWEAIEKINWVKDVIHGERSASGKASCSHIPLLAALALIAVLLCRGPFRARDVRTVYGED